MRKTTRTRWLGQALAPVVVLVALGTLVVADTAGAQPPGGPGGRAGRMGRYNGPSQGRQLMHLRALDLSEAQREQIRSIHEQNRESTQAAGERLQVARRALQDAVTADPMNEGAIRVVASELGVAEGDAAVQRASVHAQVWQTLTPEQQLAARDAEAEMEQRRAQRQQRSGERRERRQERRERRQGRRQQGTVTVTERFRFA
jgi:protein CpxP